MKILIVILSLFFLSQVYMANGVQTHQPTSPANVLTLDQSVPNEMMYLTSQPVPSLSNTWNLSGIAQPGSNSSTTISLSTTSSTGLYQFVPGIQTTAVSSIPSRIDSTSAHGWMSSTPLYSAVSAGKWNFSVQIQLSSVPTLGTATLNSAIYSYNLSNNTGTLLAISESSGDVFSSGVSNLFNYSLNASRFEFNSENHLFVSFYLNLTQSLTLSVIAITITLVTGLTNGVSSNISFPDFGVLNYTVSPNVANMTIGSKIIHITSGSICLDVLPGLYNVSFSEPGFQTRFLQVTIISGLTNYYNISLMKLYAINVTVNYFFSGMHWLLNISGDLINVNSSSFTARLVNGTYTFTFQNTVYRDAWERFVYFGMPKTVNLSGSDVDIKANYSEEYYLNISSSNLTLGTVSPLSSWENSSSTIIINASKTSDSHFSIWSGNGLGSYSGPNDPAIIHMNSSINETAWFLINSAVSYTITFLENGLPNGTTWGVDFNSSLKISDSDSILFNVVNGTYNYTLSKLDGYECENRTGTLSVNGSGVTVLFNFTRVTYSVEFLAKGFLNTSNIYWGVNLNGSITYSSNSSVKMSLPNGSYNYSVILPSGYDALNSTGIVMVNGTSMVTHIQFIQSIYCITFTEEGLATNYSWSVDLDGKTVNSMTSAITFNVTDGIYNFTPSARGYRVNDSTTQVLVDGKNVSLTVKFNEILNAKPGETSIVLSILSRYYWGIIPAIAIAVTLLYYIRRKTLISDILIVHNDGRAMRHYTQRLRPELDSDLISATMIAIQRSIKEVTTSMETGTLVQDGNNLALIPGKLFSVVLMGNRKIESSRIEHVKQIISEIEEENSIALSSWDGDYANLSFLDAYKDKFMKI